MIIAVDFDGTIVQQDGRRYDDVETPLVFMPGAREALQAFKRARHTLVLWSGRARMSLRDPLYLDPLVRAGIKTPRPRVPEEYRLNEARYRQMLSFVTRELAGVFDYIYQGGEIDKPGVDLFIDDIAVRFGAGRGGLAWRELSRVYGQPDGSAR